MRNFKRFLTLALAVVMVASTFAFGASAAQFTDVDENNEYLTKAVNLLNYVGVVKGTSDTTFGTDELVTREQMAAFIYRLMKKGQSVEGGTNSSTFTDLEDATFFFMVSWANNQGIIKGTSATTFDPKGSITLQDAYTMLIRALEYEKEESLPYPYGFIDKAESKGVELGKGLPSSVSYTDALTRGDVAILLYNAFFAEMGVAETRQVEREIGTGANATWVLETKTEYPTLCEKVFDVLEVEYQAVATPNYTFGESETTKDLGYDAILFNYVDDERTDAPAQFYAAVEDLAIDGSADDYIMSHFTMYVVLDDDNAVDQIFYAEPLMTKKTVNDIKLSTLSSNNKKSYYGDDADNAKRLSGEVVIDGQKAYFYNAPYNYAKPTYATGSSDTDKYVARNEKNLKFIDFALLGDVDDKEYKYVLEDVEFVDVDDEYFANDSVTLVNKLAQVYTNGLYEATVYDVDGDGLYDYINYMPYSFAFVDVDDDMTFNEDGIKDDTDNKPIIYTNEAVVEGEKFADEDFIIGYFNQEANYIKVAQVVEAKKANITDIRKSSSTITLSTGDKVTTDDAWKLVANYAQNEELAANGYVVKNVEWNHFDSTLLDASAYDADDAKFYVVDGVVLYQTGIDSHVKFDSNLIVVTKDENGEWYQNGNWDPVAKDTARYVYAWVDGELGWVQIDTNADVWPKLYTAKASELDDAKYENNYCEDYLNMAATYSVDADGLYTIKMLGNAYDDKAMDDKSYIGLDSDLKDLEDEDDDTLQYLGTLPEGYFVKGVGKRFAFRNGTTTQDAKLVDFETVLANDVIIVIRNEYVDGDETVVNFEQFNANNLSDTIEQKLENIQFVVSNNPNYTTREDLVLLFAEVNGEELTLKGTSSAKSEKIIKSWDVRIDSDKKYYIEYTVYDPYTGKTETVAGSKTYSSASSVTERFTYGDIVKTASGKIDENKSKVGSVTDNAQLYWIIDYDEATDTLEVAPYGTEDNTILLSTNGTSVVKIGNQTNSGDDMLRFGAFGTLTLADLASDSKDLKAANKTYSDPEKPNAAIKTVYGKYIKAYIEIDWNNSDHVTLDEDGYNGEAKFVAVIVNDAEPTDKCDLK